MRTLIDGYNLLHAAAIPGRGHGIGSLERSRLGLLHFLAQWLEPAERARTTVVFDARGAPPGLPRSFEYHGLTVRFAVRYETADALIEELVRADTAPRQLTVVSSDHQVQRAARRRKAIAIDSEAWCAEVVRRRTAQSRRPAPAPARPTLPLVAADVALWLERFGGEGIVEEVAREEQGGSDATYNPFPPGYGEDALTDDDAPGPSAPEDHGQ